MLLSLGATSLAALAESVGTQVGVCGSISDFAEAGAYGFDYFEPGAATVAALDYGAFSEFRALVMSSRLRCRSFNSLIRTLKVVGTEVSLDALTEYMNFTLDRCRQLGAHVVVWGSASSRNVPEGYSRDLAWRQIKTFLHLAGDLARSRDIVLAIEPLQRQESNVINTGTEALRLVREVNHPNVRMIIDYYHMRRENEDAGIVRQAGNHIAHIHFANPNGRLWPKTLDEDPEYGKFFEYLKRIDYRGGISIEGRGSFREDAAESLAFLRRQLS